MQGFRLTSWLIILDDKNQKRRNTRSPSPNEGMEPPSNKKAKRGLAGFSIDDILSHKTAEVMKQHDQMMKFQQVLALSKAYMLFLIVFIIN